MPLIHIGDTADGERISIPIFHTGVFAQSGTGKTKLLKYMVSQVVKQGFRVLIFDSKVTGPEFEGIGKELPFYLEAPLDEDMGSVDPDAFRSLIEGMRSRGKGNMERYRGAFISICESASSFDEVGKNLNAKLGNTKIRGYTRQMYDEIKFDYNRLMKLLAKHPFAPDLTIDEAICRIPTWKLPNLALQGVVVRSVVEYILRRETKLVIIVDEAPNYVPQRDYNPAKAALQDVDEQGRKPQIFAFYSGQTLTGFDKQNMKNLWFWIMGRELERNEAKDVYDTQTYKALTVDQVKQLKVREFIVSTPDWTKGVVTVPIVDENKLFPLVTTATIGLVPVSWAGAEDWTDVLKRVREVEEKLQ